MIFTRLDLPDAFLIEVERHEDERGFFVRTWCRREAAAVVGDIEFVQLSHSYNRYSGTLRGLHFQAQPHAEVKLVRCIRGAVYDVLVDIRPASATFGRWIGVELSEENQRAVLVPKGIAHGFQTLRNDTEVAYHISEYHVPTAGRGIRWDDPAINVRWPMAVTRISEKDQAWPDFTADQAA